MVDVDFPVIVGEFSNALVKNAMAPCVFDVEGAGVDEVGTIQDAVSGNIAWSSGQTDVEGSGVDEGTESLVPNAIVPCILDVDYPTRLIFEDAFVATKNASVTRVFDVDFPSITVGNGASVKVINAMVTRVVDIDFPSIAVGNGATVVIYTNASYIIDIDFPTAVVEIAGLVINTLLADVDFPARLIFEGAGIVRNTTNPCRDAAVDYPVAVGERTGGSV